MIKTRVVGLGRLVGWLGLFLVVSGWFGLVQLVQLVWVGLGWFGLVRVGSGWFGLVWVSLGLILF